MSPWTPMLSPSRTGGDAPIYERLLDALRSDIASGALAAGARLPPQRDLAHRLGVGLGTVTRAYVEAEKAGLVEAHVGRGSFVRGGAAARPVRCSGRAGICSRSSPIPRSGVARSARWLPMCSRRPA